jgi:hypothetical protein
MRGRLFVNYRSVIQFKFAEFDWGAISGNTPPC